jgi:hypothetical protein
LEKIVKIKNWEGFPQTSQSRRTLYDSLTKERAKIEARKYMKSVCLKVSLRRVLK